MLTPTRHTSPRLQRLLTQALSFGAAACGTSGGGGGGASDTGVSADASSAAEGGAPTVDARPPGDTDAAGPAVPDAAGPAEPDAAGPAELDAAGPAVPDAASLEDGAMPPDAAAGEDARVERADAGVESADALPPAPDAEVLGPLETFIDQPPPALTNQRVLPVRLRASAPAATFECRLDDGAFEPCAARPGLVVPEDGPHVFQARAVLGPSVDPSPAEAAFTLDTIPPALAVEGGPTGEHPRAATFLAAWDPADATLSCALDGRPLAECPPEVALVGLSEGPHRLEVTATDAAGNSTTRQVDWSVVVETIPLAAPEERRFYAATRVQRAARVAVGPDGVAHHVYGTARLWYRSTAPDAPVEVVDDVPVSLVSSVAVGTSGVPHVVYFDRRGHRLKHAWRGADGWQVEDTGLVEDLAPKRFIEDGLALVVRPDEGLELLWAQESVERLIQHATRPAVPDAGGPALVGPEAWTNQRFLPDSNNDGEIGLLALPDGNLWSAWCHGDGSSPWQTALWTRVTGWRAQPMPDATPACRGRGPPAKFSLRGDGGIDAVLGSTLFTRPVSRATCLRGRWGRTAW
jgi:hypothetical protein